MSESEHEILWNTAALTSLRRPQLVSLSKKYGLKASGKNTELAQRLYDFGQTLTPCAKGIFNNAAASAPDAPGTPSRPSAGLTPMVNGLRIDASSYMLPRDTETWEVLDEQDASLIGDERENRAEHAAVDNSASSTSTAGSKASVSSWKTAANGAALSEFATEHEDKNVQPPPARNHKSSFRSLASSILRTASQAQRRLHKRTFSGSFKNSSNMAIQLHAAQVTNSPALPSTPVQKLAFPVAEDQERKEQLLYSTQGLVNKSSPSVANSHHRTSTIQMVNSPYINKEHWDADELPLTGPNSVAQIKHRVASGGPPVILERAAQVSKVYPELPTLDVNNNFTLKSDNRIPGAFPGSPTLPPSTDAMDVDGDASTVAPKAVPTSSSFLGSPSIVGANIQASPSKFVFGAGQQPSGKPLSDVGAKLLAEMQAKAGGAWSLNPELLKGKNAEMSKLVNINKDLGTGNGFGLSRGTTYDRYAAAHQKEFAKMRSISSKVTTKPSEPAAARDADKRRTETAKNAPAEASNKRTKTTPKEDSASGAPPKTATPVRRRTLLKPASARKYALLRQKNALAPPSATSTSTPPAPCTSNGEYVLPGGDKKPDTENQGLSHPDPPKKAPLVKSSSQKAPMVKSSSHARKPLPDFGEMPPSTSEPIKDRSMGSARSRSSASSTTSIPRSTKSRDLHRVTGNNSLGKKVTRKTSSTNLRALSKDNSPPQAERSLPTRKTNQNKPSEVKPSSALPARKVNAADASKPAKKGSSESIRPRVAESTSRLAAPTASSKARTQSTVKPPASDLRQSKRVVSSSKINSSAPTMTSFGSLSVSSPYGEATSRPNIADSGFQIGSIPTSKSSIPLPKSSIKSSTSVVKSPPEHFSISHPRPLVARVQGTTRAAMSPARRANAKSPLKSPSKFGYAARTRARESGISGLKSPGGEVNQRRAELRAKRERFAEEKDLRAMLEA